MGITMSSTNAALRIKSRLYFYAAQVIHVYDGDTIYVDMDLGLGVWRHNQAIRLWKLNTPEVRGPERAEGLKVRDFVRDLLLNKTVLLRTILDKRGVDQTEKFGRLLGEVLLEGEDGHVINVNKLLLEKGMARLMSEDGTTVRSAAPMPTGTQGTPQPLPATILCPYCGEARSVDAQSAMVDACPNCLDQSFALV